MTNNYARDSVTQQNGIYVEDGRLNQPAEWDLGGNVTIDEMVEVLDGDDKAVFQDQGGSEEAYIETDYVMENRS